MGKTAETFFSIDAAADSLNNTTNGNDIETAETVPNETTKLNQTNPNGQIDSSKQEDSKIMTQSGRFIAGHVGQILTWINKGPVNSQLALLALYALIAIALIPLWIIILTKCTTVDYVQQTPVCNDTPTVDDKRRNFYDTTVSVVKNVTYIGPDYVKSYVNGAENGNQESLKFYANPLLGYPAEFCNDSCHEITCINPAPVLDPSSTARGRHVQLIDNSTFTFLETANSTVNVKLDTFHLSEYISGFYVLINGKRISAYNCLFKHRRTNSTNFDECHFNKNGKYPFRIIPQDYLDHTSAEVSISFTRQFTKGDKLSFKVEGHCLLSFTVEIK